MQIADRMAADGYKDAGYEYVNVDDCWMAKQRGPDGKLQADPKRFPSGMKALGDYVSLVADLITFLSLLRLWFLEKGVFFKFDVESWEITQLRFYSFCISQIIYFFFSFFHSQLSLTF